MVIEWIFDGGEGSTAMMVVKSGWFLEEISGCYIYHPPAVVRNARCHFSHKISDTVLSAMHTIQSHESIFSQVISLSGLEAGGTPYALFLTRLFPNDTPYSSH